MALKRGFSLIELIIVVGLLSLIMLAISSSMLMTIVSTSRIRTTTKVKQAGNYALNQFESMIRSAKGLNSCNSTTSTANITNQDGNTTDIFLENSQIASNSGNYLTPSNFTISTFVLTCLPGDTAAMSENNTNLIKISFDLKDSQTTKRTTENPLLHFETSVNLRNE